MTTAQYKWWQTALKDPTKIGTAALPVHEDEPQVGFYRKRNKEGSDQPAAIWINPKGDMVAELDGRVADPQQIWTWVCRNPVSYENFCTAANGKGWPDDPPTGVGHNRPDDEAGPFESLSFELEAEKEQADEFLKTDITDQTQADTAAAWANKLAKIETGAEKYRKAEKEPYLEAGRAVDSKWRPIIEVAADYKTKLKRHLDAWLRKQQAAEEKRQHEAEEAARRAELEAEEKAKIAAAEETRSGEDAEKAKAEADEASAKAEKAAAEAQPKKTKAGRTGATVSLRTFVSAKIVDYEKALIALGSHPEMKALVQQLANRAVKAGKELDGIERVEEKRAA